jgi:hypothetical protein
MGRQRTEQKCLTTGCACNCNAKEITILFCKQIGQSPNMSYAKCRMGLRERKMEMVGGRPDKITKIALGSGGRGRFCIGCLVNARMITALG